MSSVCSLFHPACACCGSASVALALAVCSSSTLPVRVAIQLLSCDIIGLLRPVTDMHMHVYGQRGPGGSNGRRFGRGGSARRYNICE